MLEVVGYDLNDDEVGYEMVDDEDVLNNVLNSANSKSSKKTS